MKLIIEDDEGLCTVVPLFRDELVIGRAEGNAIRLTAKDVSRRHARLARRDGRIYVEDLNSLTGVRVNGDRVHGTREIHEGDLVEIGDYDLTLLRAPGEEPPPGSHSEDATAPIRAPRGSSRRRTRIATLVLVLLVAAVLAAMLWIRSARGAEREGSRSPARHGLEAGKEPGSESRITPRLRAPGTPRGVRHRPTQPSLTASTPTDNNRFSTVGTAGLP